MKEKIKYFLYTNRFTIALVFIIALLFSIVFLNKNEAKEKNVDVVTIDAIETNNDSDNKIYVDVKGAVKKPGVYKVSSGSRVIDVLNKAKLKKNANTKYINLGKVLTDEMVIVIYTNKEVSNFLYNKSSKSICSIMVNNACLSDPIEAKNTIDSVIIPKTNDTIESNLNKSNDNSNPNLDSISGKININTASISELSNLSGIGTSKAQKIVSYRNENGYFKSISDITNVSGIGISTYERIKDSITV